jgi:hypothetical protein
MFDQLKFGVSDCAASKSSFVKSLEPLGVVASIKRQGAQVLIRRASQSDVESLRDLRNHYVASSYATFDETLLSVNAKNTRALAFYARQGYAKVGTAYFVLGAGRHENNVRTR